MPAFLFYDVKITGYSIRIFSKLRNGFVQNTLYNADTLSTADMQIINVY